MKKILGSLIILAFTALSPLNCSSVFSNTLTNEAQLSKIETSLWGFDYSSKTNAERLDRIEKNVFGTTTPNEKIELRIEKINKTLGFETASEALKSAGELAQNEVEGVSYPQIDALETRLYKKTYEGENIYKRIERLEKKIFGTTQDGDLASRTDKLKDFLRIEASRSANADPYTYSQQENTYNNYDPNTGTYGSDIYIQLSGLEQSLFGKTYSQDPTGLRINRLERKIFQRDFSQDGDETRLQRLQAAASAKKTAKFYEMNKAQKFASTGLQVGSIILMILALLL